MVGKGKMRRAMGGDGGRMNEVGWEEEEGERVV